MNRPDNLDHKPKRIQKLAILATGLGYYALIFFSAWMIFAQFF